MNFLTNHGVVYRTSSQAFIHIRIPVPKELSLFVMQ